MAIETEFKFHIAAGQHARVVSGLSVGAAQRRDLESTYFDTDELDLRKRGMQLRLRRDGERVVQTFKSKSAETGPFGREEHEVETVDNLLNVKHMAAQLPKSLRNEVSAWKFKPQFQTRFQRLSVQLSDGAFMAEECFDRGEIISDTRRADISEVEIELKSGPLPAYSAACLEFLDRIPSGLLLEGKAARGFQLARDIEPKAVKGFSAPLNGDDNLPEAILALLRRHFAHFLGNQPAVMRGCAPNSIHQMRVGIRRLRATLQSFSPVLDLEPAKPMLGELRQLFGILGEAREADVFLQEILPTLRHAGMGDAHGDVLKHEIAAYRQAQCRKLSVVAGGADFARLMINLNDWIEGRRWLAQNTPLDGLLLRRRVREFAEIRLPALQQKLFKKVNRARSGGLDDWHDARIAAKKLRYASTPLIHALLAPDDAAEYTKRLAKLQDSLGELNDLNTISGFLTRVHSQVKQPKKAKFEAAGEFCRGWSVGKVPGIVQHADQLVGAFETLQNGPLKGVLR